MFGFKNSMPDLRSGIVLDEIKDPKEEWLKSKLGVISASDITSILTYEDKPNALPKGAITLCIEKVYERIFEKRYNEFTTDAMEHGTATEPKVVLLLKNLYKLNFENTGENQIFYQAFGIGATPDGINKEMVLEIKCPQFIAHENYKEIKNGGDMKKIVKKYYDQMQTQMLVCGKDKGLFVSCFHDEDFGFFDVHKVEIEADLNYQEFIKTRAKLANDEIERRLSHYIE